ncbi:TSUP family transporter [Flavobacterium sp. NST-5]|uniref:Probable membrane transporter protein n=1 Tax=Flavobacterium ichthyis TaxID=2698827 RepID=A0ABW9ZAJ9_9FLAO|nr:sulfite exporter TauE/SafE family protein [Flavobacterium ichthyis]NBL65716.1 TSUP family transporter [Flavobacterium ichthyis]
MEEILGFIAAFIIGIVLGLTGGGGSIITVPVLVYLLQFNPMIATAYSLFIVGITSVFGTFVNKLLGNVDFKIGIKFAIPSIIAVYGTRKFIVPNIPDIIFTIHNFSLSKGTLIMVIFAIVMILAAISMIRGFQPRKTEPSAIVMFIKIFFVGIVIGFVGAGGGFLIIPALIYLAHLPMKKAIGTSIFIISINSLIGFTGDLGNISPDWAFLLYFSFLSILGIFAGTYLQRFVNEKNLKRGFGWFVLCIAIAILTQEFLWK